jgi:hypothetical protein
VVWIYDVVTGLELTLHGAQLDAVDLFLYSYFRDDLLLSITARQSVAGRLG